MKKPEHVHVCTCGWKGDFHWLAAHLKGLDDPVNHHNVTTGCTTAHVYPDSYRSLATSRPPPVVVSGSIVGGDTSRSTLT